MKKKRIIDTYSFKKRLKLSSINRNIINHLSRNSKAIYNTALYYSKKILNKDPNFILNYNNILSKYIKIKPSKFSKNGICMFLANSYKNYTYMANHISQQTIKHTYNSISSYFKARMKGIRNAKFPKYINKKGRYNICFTKNIFKKISIKNKYYIRLTLGKYIQKQYINISKASNLITNDNKKYFPKDKFINKSKYKKSNNKKMYYKVNNKKYIHKDNIIKGMYLNCSIPKHIYEKNIIEIEIKPVLNGLYYELIVKYELPKIKIKKKIKNPISIDLGLNNLLTIYGTRVRPLIINGRIIKSINQYYNKQISKTKSKKDIFINKIKNKRSKKFIKCFKHRYNKLIKRLYNRRNCKINDKIHKITRYMTNYCIANKIDTVIIGYIKGWKNKINMGTKNNQNFYGIPFLNIINKMKYKLYRKNIKLILSNESYTSKCDALSNESICFHKKYKGKRVKRGLFKSKYKKTYINADLNGAINIYRKTFGLEKNKGKAFNKLLKKQIKKLHKIYKITVQ